MILLTVSEVAELKKCSERYIQKLASSRKIEVIESLDNKNRKKYLIPLNTLPPELQYKYYKKHNINTTPFKKDKPEQKTKPFDEYTEEQQKTINFWIDILNRWNDYCFLGKSKTESTKEFIAKIQTEYPDIQISQSILYRKAKALKENNLSGLIDNRGLWKKGTSSIPDDIWQCFLSFYLDEAQHPLKCCYDYTKMWIEQELPGIGTIPSYTTFYRRVQSEVYSFSRRV